MLTSQPGIGAEPRFATTRWSMVRAAQDDGPDARQALAELCQRYWYPLYAHARRKGRSSEQAQDLTQEFFARLLEKNYLKDVDPARGSFRAFLLTAFEHFLCNEHDRQNARKRGGGLTLHSLNIDAAEARLAREPAHAVTAERLFERRWALTLLAHVLEQLQQEWADRPAHFEVLKVFLAGDRALSHQQAGDRLGMTAGAVKVAVHRLRQRYRELLRAEIGHTLDRPEEIDDEIRALFAALS
ncbi:MAG: RNA polymerase sigma factor [Gemmataceae bacterium]